MLLDLQQLALDCAHAGHQPVEFGEELSFLLTGDLDETCGGSVADAMKGIGQLSVEKPHLMLQIQELLVKLGLLEHGRDLAWDRSLLRLSYTLLAGSSRSKKCAVRQFINGQAETDPQVHRSVMKVFQPDHHTRSGLSNFVVPSGQGCPQASMTRTLFSVFAFITPISRIAFQGAGSVLAPSSPQRAAPQQGLP
jgi:hypothetical protein